MFTAGQTRVSIVAIRACQACIYTPRCTAVLGTCYSNRRPHTVAGRFLRYTSTCIPSTTCLSLQRVAACTSKECHSVLQKAPSLSISVTSQDGFQLPTSVVPVDSAHFHSPGPSQSASEADVADVQPAPALWPISPSLTQTHDGPNPSEILFKSRRAALMLC